MHDGRDGLPGSTIGFATTGEGTWTFANWLPYKSSGKRERREGKGVAFKSTVMVEALVDNHLLTQSRI